MGGGFDGDGGVPERGPILELDEVGETGGVVFRCGEGDEAVVVCGVHFCYFSRAVFHFFRFSFFIPS